MLTAEREVEQKVRGLRAGADDYLIKPFSARELIARVSAHLQMARMRRESAEVLRLSEAALRAADRRKDEFLATLAHELRNPLAPIRNAVQILRLRGDSEFQAVHDMIDRQVQHLVRLVDDLLDVSRITRGKISLQMESLDVAFAPQSVTMGP